MDRTANETPSNESPPAPANQRRLFKYLLLVLAIPLLTILLGVLALRSSSVRQAIVERLNRSIEQSTGVRAKIEDFKLGITNGTLELHGIVLATGDDLPFLTAKQARAEFDWRSLWSAPIVIRTISLINPVVDLRQTLPKGGDDPASGEPRQVDIGQLRLTGGRLLGATAIMSTTPVGIEPELTEWSADEIDVAGSFLAGLIDVKLAPAQVRLQRPAAAPVEVELTSRLKGPLAGPYVFDDFKITGRGLTLDASGEVGTGAGQPQRVRLDFKGDPSLLLEEIGAGGHLQAKGEIDLRTFRGDVHIVAKDFPAEILEPWIGEAARPGGELSRIDLEARFQGDPSAPQQVTGEADLVWRQKEQILAEARVTLADGQLGPNGVVLESLVGDITAKADDLSAELLRPVLGAENLERLAARGTRLDLDADFRVGVSAPSEPEGHLDLVWRRGDEQLLQASARTLESAGSELHLEFEATVLPGDPGRRHLAGRLSAPSWFEIADGELAGTLLDLEQPDVVSALENARRRWPLLMEDAGFQPDTWPKSLRGRVIVEAQIEGPIQAPSVNLDGTWHPSADSSVAIVASGKPTAQRGQAHVTLDQFDLGWLPGEAAGLMSGTFEARTLESTEALNSDALKNWTATTDLKATNLRYAAESQVFEELNLRAETDASTVVITALSGRTGPTRFTGDGQVELNGRLLEGELLKTPSGDPRIRAGRLNLSADAPVDGIDHLDLTAELANGVVHVTRLEIQAPTGPGDLSAEIPLGAFRALDLDVDTWPVEVAEGRIKVDLGFPGLDLDRLSEGVGQEPPWTAHTVSLTGRLWIDPFNLVAAEGELLVEEWLLEVGRHRLEVGNDPILIALEGGRLDVLPVTLTADGNAVDLEGAVELAPDWTLVDGFEALVHHLEAKAEGRVDSGLLTPYLAGGVAEGPVQFQAEISGPMDDLTAHATVDGPRAAILYASPYMTQIQGLSLKVTMAGDLITVSDMKGQLNGGPLSVNASRTPAGDWTANAKFESARFQLDYGLTTVLHGDLRLELPLEGDGSLAGSLEVDRAVQRRDLELDREILDALFAPPDISGAGGDSLDLDLDLEITTARGFRIKNNLADLHGSWGTITVQGKADNPAIEGRVDIDPGGFLYAYGQTARVDQGAVIWTGEPGLPPTLELQPTWDSQDPTIGASGPLEQLALDYGPTSDKPSEVTGMDQRLVEGLTGYVGGRLVQNLAGARVRIQPVLIFGETDPSAKLVISRDLSTWIAFAVAVDLRDSQNQTYVLNLRQLKNLPPIAFQLFTENGQTEGLTVQQTLKFGRSQKTADKLANQERRLRRVYFETVLEDISLKKLRKAIGYAKGDPLPEEAEFEVEVALVEHLRRRGYPGARVDVILEPVGRKNADLSIAIGPGPHVDFAFEGTTAIAKSLRRKIIEPYRVDFYEDTSLGEMQDQAIRALRSEGYFAPQVQVEVTRHPESRGNRTVTLRAEGGEKTQLDKLVFRGLDEETAHRLQSRFITRVARIELAAALPKADQWLTRNLRSHGYPEASITGRQLADDGRQLIVDIEAGPRQEIADLRIEGLAETEADAYLERLPLRPGQIPLAERVAAGNLLIRNHLKRRGHSEVRVRTRLEPSVGKSPSGNSKMDLVYEIEPGPQYHLESIQFTGLEATRPKWARKVTGLDKASQVLDPEILGHSRRLLVSTQLFQSVRTVTQRTPDGEAHVTFEMEEAPRFQFAYGIRWENNDQSLTGGGSSLVLDVLDRNVLGRGITVGLRGLYGERDQAARLYARRAGLFGHRLGLEIFVEQRNEETRPTQEFVDDSLFVDTTLGSLQVSFPLGKWTSQVYGRFKRTKISEKVPFDPFFPFEEDIRFPFVGWQMIYDHRDDRIAPTRGIFASTDLSITGDFLSSDFDFIRLFSQFQWTRPAFRLGERQITWAQSYRVGLFTSQDLFPLSDELFVAGGERSVRGYPFESLAADGRGGEALLVINQELRFPVWRELSGTVFFDLGNAWSDKGDFGSDLFKSVGVGIRADSPIGLLRLDFAFPLDRREGDRAIKTYFGFGHAF